MKSAEKRRRDAARQKAWRDANPDLAKAHYDRYRERNRDKCNARSKAWRLANPDAHRLAKRRVNLRRFGLTVGDYERILADQGGVCAICRRPETHQRERIYTLSVDHCHATGRVRGLLCNLCNRAIGLLRDSAELCAAAAEYLR